MIENRLTEESAADAQRLYLDFDSFFASAEQHFNPALRGKPVGVVPLDSPGTGCIAMSREAKRLGVPSGATVVAAREIAPAMIFVVARPDAYVRLHQKILTAIEACVPIAKVRSIDEVVCHLLHSEGSHAGTLAQAIKRTLEETLSDVLTCSIGIARTELLAKIAAEMNKPDGFVQLRTDNLPDQIDHLHLRDLPGVSEGIETRLHAAGIRSVKALWATERKQARAIWGNVEGERFWNELHGLHVQRPPTIKRMFGHSRNLPPDWRTPDKVRECARQLTLSAARRLRRSDQNASKMTVSMRSRTYEHARFGEGKKLRWSCEIPFAATRNDRALLEALAKGLQRSVEEAGFKPSSVSVMLHGLLADAEIQCDLFTGLADADPTQTASNQTASDDPARRDRLSNVMDQIRAKHGPSAVSYGPKVELPGGYLGAKIAFGRIPDLQDFSEVQTEDGATQFYSN
ncbi:type VI secretion protein ImpB [Altererythrobacter confluentis]|uniref:DNA-directed DNA polymerase n=1 Tax=Allopontixanthobacter confluentis TaxID=1849021 RepID=A0A6L7GC62_9SPHN|nr:type VI secretion protein ImpB [Allopontixanthobacter confluentis]MXP13642.1 type VI secretion protein ImpB [Allopontixanthobacter confluentis]